VSVRVNSWLQQAAAYLTSEIDRFRGRGRSRRSHNRITAFLSPVFAATEGLEPRQLLSAADVSVLSVFGNPGDSVDVPVQVTNWYDLQTGESLSAFTFSVQYDTQRLDLSGSDIALGTFFRRTAGHFQQMFRMNMVRMVGV